MRSLHKCIPVCTCPLHFFDKVLRIVNWCSLGSIFTVQANLKVKLGEQLLSQDLETFDEARKNRKKNRDFVTSPEQLLMSFPLRKFVELPRAILGVVSFCCEFKC